MKTAELPEELFEPMLCRSGDDFVKLSFATLMNTFDLDGTEEDMSAATTGIKILMHEYLALVLSKKIRPFGYDERAAKNFKQDFLNIIMDVTHHLAESGISMVETADGRVEIDYKKIMKEHGKDSSVCILEEDEGKK